MSKTVSLKTALIALLMLALMVPAMSFAASPSIADLQVQYQTLMSQFEHLKEKKRGDHASSTASSTEKGWPKRATSTADRTCMANAVATREAAIKTAWTTFTGSMASALDKRAAALVAVWNASSTDNQGKLNQPWITWKTDSKAAHTKLRSERKSAWDAFKKTTRESCKVNTPKAEGLEKEAKDGINL